MLAPIFYRNSADYWNFNYILDQEENDEFIENFETPDEFTIPADDILFDNKEGENLSMSECF